MKPKAKRFRIRRNTVSDDTTPASPQPVSGVEPRTEHSTPERPEHLTRLTPEDTSTLTPAEEIDQIKAEGLTGRQLRIARREAQKHGFDATSDLEAVRLLRKNGVDPFKRSDLLELVIADEGSGPDQLPAAIRHAPPPSTQVMNASARAIEVQRIQNDLIKRRQRRTLLMMVKLAFFVLTPTFLAGYYYYMVATPMYATNSEFVIQQADSAGGRLGGLFSGGGLPAIQDSITVQSYLNSRDAMARLNKDHGFKAHFQQAFIDPIQRLAPNASNEATYRVYRKRVRIGYDPTEGIIKLEVIAASPAASKEFSLALIGYAEEQVDQLTQRLRKDQMKGARASYQEAEAKMLASQRRVVDLQQTLGVLNPQSEIASKMQQISAREVQLRNRQLELAQQLDNPRPNRTKVRIATRTIQRLKAEIVSMKAELTTGSGGTTSIANKAGELRVAEADLSTRQGMLSQSLQQLETARIEANRQVRYLSVGVSPVPPDEPTYPKAFQDTLLAFLIFGGIYLMASLTASILREQITG